jgi:hypothetical protein
LSTGAYGDEGKVLLELVGIFSSILRGDEARHIEVALAWRGNLEMEKISPAVRDAFTYLATTTAARTQPMRLAMCQEALQDSKADLFNRLRESGVESHAMFEEIFDRYARLIDAREVVELVRGGDEWLVLHRFDLLVCLGPWIIEVEKARESLIEGAA